MSTGASREAPVDNECLGKCRQVGGRREILVYRLFGASSKNIPLPGQLPQPKRFGVGLTVGFTVGLIVGFTVGFNVGFTVGSVGFKRYLVSIIVKRSRIFDVTAILAAT